MSFLRSSLSFRENLQYRTKRKNPLVQLVLSCHESLQDRFGIEKRFDKVESY